MNRAERMARFAEVDLYPVTCETLSEGRSDLDILDALIAGGARIVQLREKDLTKRELFELALEFRKRTDEAGMLLMINDHLDVALAVGADGVHLGQDDLPIPEARRLAPELILGASTHDRDEALVAVEEGADYFNIGPIYPTKTKAHLEHFLGPEAIPAISKDIPLPFTVMGGIKEDNLDPLLDAGARHVAVVTAVTRAPDPAGAVARLAARIRAGRGEAFSPGDA